MDMIDFILNNSCEETPYKLEPLRRRNLEELFIIERKLNKKMGCKYSERRMYNAIKEYTGTIEEKEKEINALINKYQRE